jgi:hypothetical protein
VESAAENDLTPEVDRQVLVSYESNASLIWRSIQNLSWGLVEIEFV